MKAGVFDSGVGGLTVLKSLLEAKMFDEIVYYGDTARVPYGIKDEQTIVNFSLEALDFFTPHNVDILIVACNTASAYALIAMRRKSSIPVVGVIEPGIEALKSRVTDRSMPILIIATKATIESRQYQDKLCLENYTSVQGLATGLFVSLVEEGITNGEILQATMRYYFSSITQSPHAIILGCTHFPLIADKISEYFKNESLLIHSGEAIVHHLCETYRITPNYALSHTKLHLFSSGSLVSLQTTAKKWLNSF